MPLPTESGGQNGNAGPIAIGEAAPVSVSAKMLRRTNRWASWGGSTAPTAATVRHSPAVCALCALSSVARDLGFSMAEISSWWAYWHNRSRASASVKRIAQKHMDELNTRRAAMQAMQRSQDLHRTAMVTPALTILDDLAGKGGTGAAVIEGP
ncbi:MerR family DNA-binding protein [Candidatus Aalborgicola defluviihabitans]|uniref:MerR family DNA-binding protein n=1 Tax=Candidatus Aalborgicola defluviihabitans TaxID=3386187 RepID=UPI0039B94EBC